MTMMGFVKWVSVVSLVLVVFLDDFTSIVSDAAFTPADNYLIACGASQNVTVDGRTFVPDAHAPSLLITDQGTSVVSSSNSAAPSPIYQTARVFSKPSSYRFGISQGGRHWVRLYFFPVPSSAYSLNSTSLTVVTEDFVLLDNYTLKNQSHPFLFKEYLINVTSDHLTIVFVPTNGSLSFVNAIEVVSVPDDLISDPPSQVPDGILFSLTNLAMETVYRLNVGGPRITSINDTLGRTWENDRAYLFSNNSANPVFVDPSSINYGTLTREIAPNSVYAYAEAMANSNVANVIYNITWSLPVDPNFLYFIRLHFCDIISTALNQLIFNAYVTSGSNFMVNVDPSKKTNELMRPFYIDFVTNVSFSSALINVSIGPDPTIEDIKNATLNGLEVLKLSNDAGSLDGLLSVRKIYSASESKKKKTTIVVLGVIVGGLASVLLLAVYYCCFVGPRSKSRRRAHPWLPLQLYGHSHTISKVSTTSQKSGTASCISLANSSLGRLFTFQEIMDATNKFDEALLLGVGGFGKVYKGTLDDGTRVAVKRGNPRSEQGLNEFQTEIQMLSKLRHRHLVSLIGYCDERSEMILVYEYMANGPLRSHLYGSDLPPLLWKQRLEICIGAARGLHYLHTGATQSIIHRDVKTTNILLDENFVAKVADFGLSKTGPALDQTHVSTAVKGSFGYLDPEYFRRQQLTEKSDVYSFGVVLMEVLCSRPALNPVLPREQVNIAEWAMMWQKKGMLDQIMDPGLIGRVNPASLKKFGETAEKCLAEHGVDRPTIGDVLWNLEYALQLQETSALVDPDDNSTNHIADIPISQFQQFDNSTSMVDEARSVTDDDLEDATTSAVFSQLVNPKGR
ncbi:receptor-like protein kinase THESEUS 1 [Nymphaea colorata]|nr:receptor-like protein kinase THESEUS 1 [Nymphaea colorata]